ncbi:MAG: DegT/DnrJ/EryC1/StrS family aminotransferase [Clostridia bacterium]|nr:DegT/DnrJ/EryC1/StrS family aminotransferase [Clostridia bacterium]
MMNAIPVLAEIDDSLTIDPEKIEALITPKTKAIIPVHMLGNPCKMDRIMEIAKKHNLYVIEDCCQAVGASYKGKCVGTIGNIGAYSMNVFKTLSTGDGGFVGVTDEDLYERAFGFHDQGHKPSRTGVEVGNRSILGINMRMNELSGAVALAQTRKLKGLLATLREKKALLKSKLQGLPGVGFRTINDEGECATLLTLLFETKELAAAFCEKAGTAPIARSGWHVYNNMEQLLEKKTWTDAHVFHNCDRVYEKHMLPATDDILERAVNISIGVVDKGLGAGTGINILSTEEEIEKVAQNIREIVLSL